MRDDPSSAEVESRSPGPNPCMASGVHGLGRTQVRPGPTRCIGLGARRLGAMLLETPPRPSNSPLTPAHPSAFILHAESYSAVAPTSFTIFAQNAVWFLRNVANSSGDLLVTISAPPFAMRLTTSGSSMVLIITA